MIQASFGMEVFMSEVRDLVVPRLKTEEDRVRAWIPRLVWAKFPLSMGAWLVSLMGNATLGETFYVDHNTPTSLATPEKVALYEQSFLGHPQPQPFGHMVAFVLIHELAHAVCACGHHNERWASACRDMGIAEVVYDKKTECGKFAFNDAALLEAIKQLPSYPQDVKQ